MFVKNVYSVGNLPVQEKQRKWTDCCCTIIGAIFALTLFIIACASFNRNNFYQVNYPSESSGKLCYLDLPNQPFVFFRYPTDTTRQRYCVSTCPAAGQAISCSAGTNCAGIISTYSTTGVINGLGGICEPTNPATRTAFLQNPSLRLKLSSVHMWGITLLALIISAAAGAIYLILFSCLPKKLTFAVFVLAAIVLVTAGILLIVQPLKLLAFHGNAWNIILGIIFILMGIAMVIFMCCQKQQIEIGSIFLSFANNFLKDRCRLFIYIPFFMLFSLGLVVLCTWQYIAIGSANTPTWTSTQVYKHIQYSLVLQILNLIEFVWGIQFIRDSFNYIISGYAVEWYFTYNKDDQNHDVTDNTSYYRPVTRYFCRNFGSVVGGSFINAFLNIICLIFDLFRCDPKGPCGKATACCRCVCCCCCSVVDLSRADAYAYIHLSGIPYCNAARQCQAICLQTNLFNSDDTCIRLYRIAAQVFVVTLSVLITLIIIRAKVDYVSMFALAVLICYCYLMSTHFVDIHSNGAQALVTCYLTEANCEGQQMEVCPQNLRNEVYNFEKKYDLASQWTQ